MVMGASAVSRDKVGKDLQHFRDNFLDYVIGRLSGIHRYSTGRVIKPQSVMQHSGSVTLITMVLSDYFKSIGIKNDTEKALRLAIMHDSDETVTGDLPHAAKYVEEGSEELRKALNKLNQNTMNKMLSMLKNKALVGRYGALYDEIKDHSSVEAKIVKLADSMDVVIYARHERSLGNSTLLKAEETASRRFDDMLLQVLSSKGRA